MDYSDIIDLPHYEPKYHPRMSMMARAAQFAPFAALTGHEDAIRETARLTDSEIILGEHDSQILDRRLAQIRQHLGMHPAVSITYFVPDTRKSGGRNVTISGEVRDIDDFSMELVLWDGRRIPIEHISELQNTDGVCEMMDGNE